MAKPAFQGRNFTANLDGVAVGDEVVAFHEQDLLWYRAVVDGIHAAPEGGTYYTVSFKSVPGCTVEDPVSKYHDVDGPLVPIHCSCVRQL
jgi:hypothetical protein